MLTHRPSRKYHALSLFTYFNALFNNHNPRAPLASLGPLTAAANLSGGDKTNSPNEFKGSFENIWKEGCSQKKCHSSKEIFTYIVNIFLWFVCTIFQVRMVSWQFYKLLTLTFGQNFFWHMSNFCCREGNKLSPSAKHFVSPDKSDWGKIEVWQLREGWRWVNWGKFGLWQVVTATHGPPPCITLPTIFLILTILLSYIFSFLLISKHKYKYYVVWQGVKKGKRGGA